MIFARMPTCRAGVRESLMIVFVAGYPEQDIFHPLARFFSIELAYIDQGVDNGCTDGRVVIPAEQEVLPTQRQRLMAFSIR